MYIIFNFIHRDQPIILSLSLLLWSRTVLFEKVIFYINYDTFFKSSQECIAKFIFKVFYLNQSISGAFYLHLDSKTILLSRNPRRSGDPWTNRLISSSKSLNFSKNLLNPYFIRCEFELEES